MTSGAVSGIGIIAGPPGGAPAFTEVGISPALPVVVLAPAVLPPTMKLPVGGTPAGIGGLMEPALPVDDSLSLPLSPLLSEDDVVVEVALLLLPPWWS